MPSFSEYLHSADGLAIAKEKHFKFVRDDIGTFSHLSDDGKSAVFKLELSETRVPLRLADGSLNPELNIIRSDE